MRNRVECATNGAERHRSGRVFLAGDAAHLFPAGGSALNVGMTDAANLAWKLAGRLRGRVSEEVLDTYESERQHATWPPCCTTRASAIRPSQARTRIRWRGGSCPTWRCTAGGGWPS
ncbi:FAD-dependent monooxygenase [Nonomuraea fastidiosa]|jgi:2-polyprenyl-6-methoxyphenol hydroxylase-like FAD-dependent oxidoreductase|uniref:FAD-dependent monooxygenase n=1 Tax=Nonomuraea TaxID=83681 RepID=UPI00324E8AF2